MQFVSLPTSPDRRACETASIKIIHPFPNPSPDSQTQQPKAAKHQPKQPRQDPCIHHPRQDASKSDPYLFIGATARRHRLPQRAIARRVRDPPLPESTESASIGAPPARDYQIGYFGTLAALAKPKWDQRLAASTRSPSPASKAQQAQAARHSSA